MAADRYLQNIIISSSKFKEGMDYWLDKMQGNAGIGSFPADFEEGEAPGYIKEELHEVFPDSLSPRIISLSGGSSIGVYIVLLSAVKYILYRYTGDDGPILGMPLPGSGTVEETGVNPVLALRTPLEGCDTFKELLLRVKETVLGAMKYRNIPMDKIVPVLTTKSRGDGFFNPDIIVSLENIHNEEVFKGMTPKMVFSFKITGEVIEVGVGYNSSLYQRQTVEVIARQVAMLLDTVTKEPGINLSGIDILSEEEKRDLLNELRVKGSANRADYEQSDGKNREITADFDF